MNSSQTPELPRLRIGEVSRLAVMRRFRQRKGEEGKAVSIGLFFGLDFLLLYGAFWLNYRSARAREEVTVSRTSLSIRKFTPAGRMTEHTFKTLWARFFVQRHEEFGITSMAVAGEGRQTDIGSFLNPDDRESFAKALTGALATAKQWI